VIHQQFSAATEELFSIRIDIVEYVMILSASKPRWPPEIPALGNTESAKKFGCDKRFRDEISIRA
jgi:hypothetical protein